jgi:transposase
MPFVAPTLRLKKKQRHQLESLIRRQSAPAAEVLRARILLGLAAGESYQALSSRLRTSSATIALWRSRFEEDGVPGLRSRHVGSEARVLTPALRAKIIRRALDKPGDGSTHWSCRKLAADLQLGTTLVHRVLREADLKPHRLERYMASPDPDFETKAADIIGLYMQPPQHAAVFCVEEKTAIQALDRLDPVLPLSPGRAERHGFEYFRHGTLSLYAALNTATGAVIGKTAARHTSAEFVAFLEELLSACPADQPIHVILDNLSAHKTRRVAEFLAAHPRLQLHYTPTYSSWLNQVELWFSKIERDLIARGVFTSVADLRRQIMRYIRQYAKRAKPIRWKYTDLKRRYVA